MAQELGEAAKQGVHNGQARALLKGDRAKMLSMCPDFQKFKFC